jgi:septal ring factor EnvC (AmiA/AmiB activator)
MPRVSNDQVVKMIQEKLGEKNEVIKEQQMQIQELQEKLAELESHIAGLQKAEKEREELIDKLTQVLE